jgi:flavin reductase (DIM6/NTAB) family NADH-FMN oxidoreductase RutF
MREKIDTFAAYAETMAEFGGGGCLLVTGGQGNPMTIGWGLMGIVWGRPVFTVLVRPSRFSYGLLAASPQFTVNVPAGATAGALKKALAVCGSRSGRDTDKISLCGLTLQPGILLPVPHIRECPLHYECRVLQTAELPREGWDEALAKRYYPQGDFHRVHFAEILGAFREPGAAPLP